jgi:prepilin-type N-terminal cleavage/methylation domain-containing protein
MKNIANIRGSSSRGRAGLTLIELVVVVAILAIVAGFIIPSAVFLENRAKYTTANASLAAIRDAIVGTPSQPGYYSDTGQYPVTLRDLFVNPFVSTNPLVSFNRDTGRGWRGPYLTSSIGALYKDNNSSDASFSSGTYPAAYGAIEDPIILDPWGNAIVVQYPQNSGTPDPTNAYGRLISAGPNGIIDTQPGTTTSNFYPLSTARGDDIVLFLTHADAP